MKREEILALCTSNPEFIVTYTESLESQIKELTERSTALESRLNQNSRNSSKPPSTDFFIKEKPNPKSLRKKSGKKPGGQEGYPGTTLDMVNNPEQVIEHFLTCCKECGYTLENVEVKAYERRQVFDIPPVNLIVTEHKSQIKACPHCGKLNKAAFPESEKYPVDHQIRICKYNVKFLTY